MRKVFIVVVYLLFSALLLISGFCVLQDSVEKLRSLELMGTVKYNKDTFNLVTVIVNARSEIVYATAAVIFCLVSLPLLSMWLFREVSVFKPIIRMKL